jgi:ABC-type glycerol-3-phosphate transport system permease component
MQFFYRTLFVVPMVIPGLITVLIWRSFFFEATNGYLNQFLDWSGVMAAFQHAGAKVSLWLADPAAGGLPDGSLGRAFAEMFGWLTSFKEGTSPAWLGDPNLLIIACVIWGFPWVGSFAVLTHLAKLQNISKDIYEAADIDGATWWTRFTKIELPLLMGSIYLLLVFAIIDTIKDAGMVLALCGITGGPGGRATVPALFMLRKAFMDQQMGYACAVGIVLTVVVLLLQKVCNMLLNSAEVEEKRAPSAAFGVLVCFAIVQAYFYVKSILLPAHATLGNFAAFTALLLAQLAALVALLWAVRRRRSLRPAAIALGCALMLAGVFLWTGPLHAPAVLIFGSALFLAATPGSLFKAFIGAAGGVLLAYGVRFASVDLMVTGLIFIILATPWGLLFKRFDKARLARLLKRPPPAVSRGDLYVARSFARQQNPVYHASAVLGDWGLRFTKHLFIWFVLAFAFLPLYLMIIVSLKENTQFYLAPTTLTFPVHWDNWSTAWSLVSPTVANSIFLSTMGSFFIILFGLFGAYFFARLKVPGSSFLWNALLLLMMMPMIANLVPLFILLRDMNLLNTLTALILVGASGGQAFAIFVFRNFIADIPQDLFEAAEIDGANHFQQLKLVVIPLSGPIMGTVAVMQFLSLWNDFTTPLIIMREQARLPVTVQLMRMSGEYIKLWGPLMAGYAIASIPVIVLFTFSMKLFVKGLTEGAVKG